MRSDDSFDITSINSESEILDITESFVRSDIADIISKMYTPRAGHDEIVNDKDVSKDNVWDIDETQPKKRFGFYFQSITERSMLETSRDSSTSDVVSLPSVKNKPKPRYGFVCKCCKQHILHRISEKRKRYECSHCKRKYLESVENSRQNNNYCNHEHVKYECLGKRPNKFCDEVILECNYESKDAKPSDLHELTTQVQNSKDMNPSVCYCHVNTIGAVSTGGKRQSKSSPVMGSRNTQDAVLMKPPSSTYDTSKEPYQIVPEVGKGDNGNITIQKEFNYDSKERRATIFQRFFGSINSWSGTFHIKTKGLSHETTKVSRQNVLSKHLNEIREKETYPAVVEQIQDTEVSQYSLNLKNSQHIANKPCELKTLFTKNKSDQSQIEQTLSLEKCTVINVDTDPILPQNVQSKDLQEQQAESNNVQSNKIVLSDEESTAKIECIQPHKINTECSLNNVAEKLDLEQTQPNILKALNDEYSSSDKNVQTEESNKANVFWDIIFTRCHVVVSFFTSFILQLLKFLLLSVLHPLLWETTQVISEYFFQPCLGVIFKSIFKPVFAFLQNMAESVRDFCQPIAQCLGYFVLECSSICRACRVFDIQHIHRACDCNKKT